MNQSPRFRTICRLLAALFLLAGTVRLGLAFVPLADPLLSRAAVTCDPCRIDRDPVFLLEPESERREAWRTPGAAARISAHAERPGVRAMLFAAEAVRAGPLFTMFLALAIALSSLGAAGFNARALRWLRRAAAAAVLWTLAQPVSQSLRWTAFSPLTHTSDVVHIVVGWGDLLWGVLIAGAVWISVRAIEGAVALQQDLEEYV